ncbi:hypothetical protein [Vibrio ouci]|uniref:Uncharacterized protein n=1 Tax=Vibrio ouci TaxID=2499078 RepID=A0A4Y8WA18_9VIBR|nr:hypothetical protein [Vibrio ouci]TFH89453.1 hypothetical protein ELS82_22220 [Vibrio ouci]
MKTLINSLKENTTNRLKNPLIGAFVFSWTIWNGSDLIVFFLSNNEKKIALVEQIEFNITNDLLAPSGLTLLYLLIIPILNMLYERLIDGVVNKHRNAFNQKTLQQHYYTVKKTTIAKLDSDEDENRKLRDRQLDTWANEKRQMSETVVSFRREYSEKIAKIDNEISSYKEEIRRLTSEVYDLNTEVDNFQRGLSHMVRDVDSGVGQLLSVADLPQRAEDAVKRIKDASIRARKVLKVPVLISSPGNDWEPYNEPLMDFDENIPF